MNTKIDWVNKIIQAELPLLNDSELTREEHMLMLGTCAVESDFRHRRQLNDGPARGLWQMEGRTAVDIFDNYLQFRRRLRRRLYKCWLHLSIEQHIEHTQSDLELHLERNDIFALCMARLHYRRVSDPIPTTVEEQAEYWKRFYNTPEGTGTPDDYLKKWEQYDLDQYI